MSNFSDFKVYPRTNAKFKALRGNGSCVVGGLVRVNFTILEGPKGIFAGLPERTYEKDGETKHVNEVGFPSEKVYAEFQDAVRAAYSAELDKSATTKTTPSDESDDDIPF